MITDAKLRVMLFAYVDKLVARYGTPLSSDVLRLRFQAGEHNFQLLQQNGIFRPASLDQNAGALIITTGVKGRYRDDIDESADIIKYKYQDRSPSNHFNKWMRDAMEQRSPLLYLIGVAAGQYLPLFPCFVEADNWLEQYFEISVGPSYIQHDASQPEVTDRLVRRYATFQAVRRLHQADFRERVMAAYHTECAICRLKIPKLLDAAHIIPDGQPNGEPIVPNGLSLCKIHHAAFDQMVFGIRPDYKIEVADAVLRQTDGPMLKHGIQDVHGETLRVPSKTALQPDPERLRARYELFIGS